MSGPKIAALYGLKPHTLGLCGPKEALRQQTLRKFLLGHVSVNKIEKILKQFKGAYPYYKLIAKSNKIKNPFDQKVIKAYWIGNKLLDKVKIGDLRQMIIKEFSGPGLLPKKIAIQKAVAIPENSKPHHSFHVLFIGSVTGSINFKSIVLKDLCRIGWGKVEKCAKGKILITTSPLIEKKGIQLGKPVPKEMLWNQELLPKVKIGDWISFHWGQTVEVLTSEEIAALKKYTKLTLKLLSP